MYKCMYMYTYTLIKFDQKFEGKQKQVGSRCINL